MTPFSLLMCVYFLSLFGLINFARTWTTLLTLSHTHTHKLFVFFIIIYLLLLSAFLEFFCYFFSKLLRYMLNSLILSCHSYIRSSGYKFVSLLFSFISQDLIWIFCYHTVNIYHFYYGFLFEPWNFKKCVFEFPVTP